MSTPPGVGSQNFSSLISRFRLQRGLIFGTLIITALLAFEIFNYSTTDFALADLLGDLRFAGIRWATILAIAFCGIDFAGIARLFTPQEGADEPTEVWYLFGAWMLAATMNAMLTWWGVSLAIVNHSTLGGSVINQATLLKIVPIFVAVMVWLIRVLIIGSFSVAGDRLFSQPARGISARPSAIARPAANANRLDTSRSISRPASSQAASAAPSFRPAARSAGTIPAETNSYSGQEAPYANRPEPTYHPVAAANRNNNNNNNHRPTSQPPRRDL